MAKIKIQGNASGTGVITLIAPNTNTDRTVTLPDDSITLGGGVDGITSSADATAITIDSNENVGVGTSTPGRKFAVSTDGAKTDTSTKYVQNLGQSNESSGFAQLGLYFKGNSSTSLRTWQVQPSSSGVSNDGIVEFNADGGQLRANRGIWFGTDTAAANALDDYEEGTFTLAMYSGQTGTITNTTATYTKIGRNVTVNFFGNINGAQNNSIVRISGLPFAMNNVGISVTAAYGQRQVIGLYFNNAGYFYYQNTTVGGNNAGQDAAWLDASTSIYFTATYMV
jgi:hypothetical protein